MTTYRASMGSEVREATICPNALYGQHIQVRCDGCNVKFSTKNIGSRNNTTNRIGPWRTVFMKDATDCVCKPSDATGLIHVCEVDDK